MFSFSERLAPCPICSSQPVHHHYLFRSRINRSGWPGSPYCHLQICKLCGFVFVSPRLSKEGYEAFYQGSNYSEDSKTTAIALQERQLKARAMTDFISGSLDPNLNIVLKVLDLGCGFGDTLAAFRENYQCDVVGVEISSIASDYAHDVYGIEVIRANLEEHPEIKGSFDVVVCSAVLEHLLDPRSFVRYIKSLTKDGGVIYISVPDLKSIDFKLLKGHLLNKVFKPVHTCYFDETTLGRLLESEGLKVISQKRVWAYDGAPQAELWVLVRPAQNKAEPLQLPQLNWRRTAFFVWKKSALIWVWSETVNVIKSLLGRKITTSIYNTVFKR